MPLLRNGANRGFVSASKAKQKRARRLLKNRAPAQMRSRCAGRGGAGLWVKPRGTKRRTLRPCADAVLPLGILRANRRMRFAERCSALVPLLRNGANRGFVSAPKAKQKRARRLFFVWYSRWESNPERPLRRGLLYPFNYGSVFVWSGRCTASDGSFRCPGGARRSCFYFTPFPWKRQPFFRDKFYNERGVPARRLCCVSQSSDKYSLYFV